MTASIATLARSLQAELATIGAAMLDANALGELVAMGLEPRHFGETNGLIWDAMLAMYAAGTPVDLVTLAEELRARGELEPIGGVAILAGFLEATPTAAHALHHGKIVRESAERRDAQAASYEVYASGNTMGLDEIAAKYEERLSAIYALSAEQGAKMVTAKQAVKDVYRAMDVRFATPDGAGIPWGIKELDELAGGMLPGLVTIVAARPSLGKTSMALQMARDTAGRGIPAAFFSLEMSTESATTRLLASEAKIDEGHIIRGTVESACGWPALLAAAATITKLPLYIDDRNHTIGSLRSEIRRAYRQHGVRFVVIDYLQLVKNKDDRSREAEVAGVSAGLRLLAKELKIPFLVLAQLNRGNESGASVRTPRLADLRESGSIEQDAAMVAFIHGNPAAPNPDERDQRTIIVAKNRHGRAGEVPVRFVGKGTRFESAEAQEESVPF